MELGVIHREVDAASSHPNKLIWCRERETNYKGSSSIANCLVQSNSETRHPVIWTG